MHHINGHNEVSKCRAQSPSSCPFGQVDGNHFESKEEAEREAQQRKEKEHGEKTLVSENKRVRYSFLAEFEEKQKQFEVDFEGFPTRFFNSAKLDGDLDKRGDLIARFVKEDATEEEQFLFGSLNGVKRGQFITKLANHASTPDDNKMPTEEAIAMMKRLGFTNIKNVSEENDIMKHLKNGERGFMADYKGKTFIISDANFGNDMKAWYSFRGLRPQEMKDRDKHFFHKADLRKLAGVERIERKNPSGIMNLMVDNVEEQELSDRDKEFYRKSVGIREKDLDSQRVIRDYSERVHAKKVYDHLKTMQIDGANFKAQQKYVEAQRGSVATAWQDKKNPDAQHEEMMKTTPLNKHFAQVEIDNDVDPEEMKKFESDYADTVNKLPAIPGHKKPILRIRKLGKHKATGVYFPHVNTIAIDVRDSSAFIHEYGHYVDLTVQNNKSLTRDFREITNHYQTHLHARTPAEAKYFNTPTEIYARGFEMYAHEKLGINNKLVNPEKFTNADYKPFSEHPEMKQKLFSFFDKVIEDTK